MPRNEQERKLKVFLCHSSGDKPAVRELYYRLQAEGWIDPWLDEQSLFPGQRWREEIPKAVQNSDVVVVCLSRSSITKQGYVQREIKFALDLADEKPENTIFLIPLRLEECNIPDRLSDLHWVNLFDNKGYERLLGALEKQANSLQLHIINSLKFPQQIVPAQNISILSLRAWFKNSVLAYSAIGGMLIVAIAFFFYSVQTKEITQIIQHLFQVVIQHPN